MFGCRVHPHVSLDKTLAQRRLELDRLIAVARSIDTCSKLEVEDDDDVPELAESSPEEDDGDEDTDDDCEPYPSRMDTNSTPVGEDKVREQGTLFTTTVDNTGLLPVKPVSQANPGVPHSANPSFTPRELEVFRWALEDLDNLCKMQDSEHEENCQEHANVIREHSEHMFHTGEPLTDHEDTLLVDSGASCHCLHAKNAVLVSQEAPFIRTNDKNM